MSSVPNSITSSGMSSHVSSAGWSGVVSIEVASAAGADVAGVEDWPSFSLLLSGGLLGGGAEDIVWQDEGEE